MKIRKIRLVIVLTVVALALTTMATVATAQVASKAPSAADAKAKACSSSKPAIKVGTTAPVDTAGLSLATAVNGVKAGVKAFNARGGIGGACLSLLVCDNKNDPNLDRDCARRFVDGGYVATFNDFFNGDEAGAVAIEDDAHISRIGYNPGTALPAVNSPYSFDFSAGGLGTTVAMVPALLTKNVKGFTMDRVDVPGAAALKGLMTPMITALGMNLTADVPVPATATDFTQFVLGAGQSGSKGAILPLGDQQARQILKAAQQVNSKLVFSTSLGTLSQKDMKGYGSFAKQIVTNGPFPPTSVVGDPKYPGLKQAVKDLAATHDPLLQKDTATNNALSGWLAVDAFVTIMKGTAPASITRDSVFAAFNAAKNVDLGGLIAPWTPSAQNDNKLFSGVSVTAFSLWSWNGKNFKYTKTIDAFKLLSGTEHSI